MEWKKIKLMLIVLFIFVNMFLLYMLYNKNVKGHVDTIKAIEAVFSDNNVMVIPDMNQLIYKPGMKKLLITGVDGMNDNFLITLEESENYQKIGVKKEIVNISVVLSNFIRDFTPNNLVIKNIYLGYFFDSNKISENIVSGEAEPCWILETNKGKHIYNAYSGKIIELMTAD